ncbi:MAG: NAD(P)H-quinone oxidoreductase [Chromatiales bacterium]|nr:NAD(P)H-quinone oxidoreductase [Chromatiales bacterium]
MPADMTAIEISTAGKPDVLRSVRRPLPLPGAGEVLIRVAAAGVNRPDCLQRRGLYPPPEGASDLPGLEVAGTIVALAGDVTTLSVGDRVCALLAGGGYAEYCTAPAVQCLPIPAGLDFAQAAALPETFFTVWTNIFDRGRLTSGESLLVHGGASGIGTTAIQLARAFGCRVFTTAGTDEKCRLCEELGAERAINYHQENFLSIIKSATGGVDVILDIVGSTYLDNNTRLLNPEGRLIIIGVLGDARGELNLGRILTKRLVITGSTLRARSPATKGDIARSLYTQVWPKIEAGTITPVIQKRLPLVAAARAHEMLEANEAMGKIVLLVDN